MVAFLFSQPFAPPPEESTPTKEGKNQLGGCLGNKAAQRLR